MFANISGVKPPPDPKNKLPQGEAPSLQDQKLSAWALAAGIRLPLSQTHGHFRSHRGELPDVDFSGALPMRSRKSLFRDVFQWIGRQMKTNPDRAVSGALGHELAETPPRSYIEPVSTGDSGQGSASVDKQKRTAARPVKRVA
ncbi:hypothetical protein ABFT80_22475 [Mesorhizobium sp. SB112]|uniref:hypothetical protein n=1 Tax=Mesorhizobium sp. SB112 TaxID=3151853 RepID=UPI0032673993